MKMSSVKTKNDATQGNYKDKNHVILWKYYKSTHLLQSFANRFDSAYLLLRSFQYNKWRNPLQNGFGESLNKKKTERKQQKAIHFSLHVKQAIKPRITILCKNNQLND